MSDFIEGGIQYPTIDLVAVLRLTKDLRQSARLLAPQEARFLVDEYYARQEDRIRNSNQEGALTKSGEPNALVGWLSEQNMVLEKQIATVLDKYSISQPIGQWMRGITGIGPVIAAGFLAHIDIERAQTAGALWKFAGYDPSVSWEKGQKRPWNTKLKTLCWKLGESFVKVSSLESDYYGKVYANRKKLETTKNEKGDYAEFAQLQLKKRTFAKDTDAFLWYSGQLPAKAVTLIQNTPNASRPAVYKKLVAEAKAEGTGQCMLPPGHIHARAKRYAVKLFLSHLHEVWYTAHFGVAPPKPYATTILEHAHYIPPPRHVK